MGEAGSADQHKVPHQPRLIGWRHRVADWLKGRLQEVRERLAIGQHEDLAADWGEPPPSPAAAGPPCQPEPGFLELFAGVAGLTRAVQRAGAKVLDPVETFLADSYAVKVSDLTRDAEFRRVDLSLGPER